MGESILDRFLRWYRLKPPSLRRLMTVNVVVYLVWVLVLGHIDATRQFVTRFLALNPDLPDIVFQPWQLLTYSFLHLGFGLNGLIHIGFNMLWLLWIGRDYEDLYGPRRMTWLYVVSAIGGGLLTVVLHALFPEVRAFSGYVHGASGAVLGVIAAVATLQPHKRIALLFLGTWPLRWLLFAFLAFDLLFGLASNVSVSAHLGGALAGFLFARYHHLLATGSSRRESRTSPSTGGGGFLQRLDQWLGQRDTAVKKRKRSGSPKVSDADVIVEIDESEIDRILDKINEEGYDALTEREKRLLYEASKH